MNNKPFSPCIPSHKLNNNTKVTGEKRTHLRLQCLVNVAEWGNSVCYALLYTDNALFYLFFVHALCNRYHNNIPKQANEGGANVRSWLEQDCASHGCFWKENRQMIHPRQQQYGTGTQMDANGKGWCEFWMELFFLFAGGGDGGLGETAGLKHQKGLANYNPELKREVKDFACLWESRHVILPVPVDQECQAAYLSNIIRRLEPSLLPGSIPAPTLLLRGSFTSAHGPELSWDLAT